MSKIAAQNLDGYFFKLYLLSRTVVLRLCANSLKRNKTTLGYYFRRIQSRCGYSQAIVATAHKIAKIFFTMIKNRTEYDESETGINERDLLERKITMTQR